jgi:nitronate monooxygenase/enoyl-[acyl-carrier protein] reductase II
VVAVDVHGRQHPRYQDLIPLPGMHGNLAEMALYAGQSVGLVRDTRSAAEIIASVTAEATAATSRWQGVPG